MIRRDAPCRQKPRADVATGDILVFIDADVVASVGDLARVAEILEQQPDIAAVFGAYDDAPGHPGFMSQYKNLAHSFIHRTSSTVAQTFWAGFGAVRRDAFLSVGGFDERFERPSVEDIDLGYRLNAAGFRLMLDSTLRCCHLKRWTESRVRRVSYDSDGERRPSCNAGGCGG
ncbi:glycosyltransferase [bacterium]|nr:glycosyltransferase [bacterium]